MLDIDCCFELNVISRGAGGLNIFVYMYFLTYLGNYASSASSLIFLLSGLILRMRLTISRIWVGQYSLVWWECFAISCLFFLKRLDRQSFHHRLWEAVLHRVLHIFRYVNLSSLL